MSYFFTMATLIIASISFTNAVLFPDKHLIQDVVFRSMTKRQTDECSNDDFLDCSQLAVNASPLGFEGNTTEYIRRTYKFLEINCGDPCSSVFKSYYTCRGSEQLLDSHDIICLKYDDEFCFPKVIIAEANEESNVHVNRICNNFTSSTCSPECSNVTKTYFDDINLGCCGYLYFNSMVARNLIGDTTYQDNIQSCLGDDYYGDCSSALGLSGMGPVGVVAMVFAALIVAVM